MPAPAQALGRYARLRGLSVESGFRPKMRQCKMLKYLAELAAGVEELLRINRLAVDPGLVVQVRPG
jgi:hypothetical protein